MADTLHCMVCEGVRFERLFTSKGHPIVRCGDCGFCQVERIPSAGELERLYTDLHAKHVRFRDTRAAQRENQSRLAFVRSLLPAGGRLLDAGCATGDFIAEARTGYDMHGVDIAEGAVASARQRFPELAHQLRCSRLEDLTAEGLRFDGICLWDVIEHVPDPAAVIRLLMELLKPGGVLFLSTPDMGSLAARAMGPHWAFMIPPLHLGYFSRRSFEHVFSHRVAGEIVRVETRGKWTSVAFLFYKLGQIHPWFAPVRLMRWLGGSAIGRTNIYVPTNDIMYLAVRKPGPTT
jgi:2-polyprenyl-3-methyl-5-hydroxy-6-metoxy-1,4-benzoquinol methylase